MSRLAELRRRWRYRHQGGTAISNSHNPSQSYVCTHLQMSATSVFVRQQRSGSISRHHCHVSDGTHTALHAVSDAAVLKRIVLVGNRSSDAIHYSDRLLRLHCNTWHHLRCIRHFTDSKCTVNVIPVGSQKSLSVPTYRSLPHSVSRDTHEE